MHSYFARHEVDKDGKTHEWGSDTDPSAGYIAWLLGEAMKARNGPIDTSRSSTRRLSERQIAITIVIRSGSTTTFTAEGRTRCR